MKPCFKINLVTVLSFISIMGVFCSCQRNKSFKEISIITAEKSSQISHAIDQLKLTAEREDITLVNSGGDLEIMVNLDTSMLPESFSIIPEGKIVNLSGGDPTGIMYGILDIRDQLARGQEHITKKTKEPHLEFRAIKFNLPWDAYRGSKTLVQHTETCRDTVFWEAFLDMMADNRFNVLTLWNLHPFNYMVKLPDYPEANTFTEEEMNEWQLFWTTLFRMAKDRGIDTYIVNWNIFVPSSFAQHHQVSEISQGEKKHLGAGDTSQIVKEYTKASVTAVINQYPDLTGLGITLGEGMGEMTAEHRERWLLETIIQGAREADRKIKFIHRVPLSAGTHPAGSTSLSVEKMTRKTLDTLSCFDGPINIELKFNWSHAFSSPKLVKVHGGKLNDTYWNPLPENYYLAWMMRNEDFFILRWGQNEFIREHLKENVHPYVGGYYVGSETYIPAKDYITSLPGASYKYAFERQWMFYKAWGHLLYDPSTPDSYFESAFEDKFPRYGKKLFKAQQMASKVPLIIASYWNARWDFTLYSEGMLGFNDGPPAVKLLSLETLANKIPLEPAYQSISEFMQMDGRSAIEKISPLALADSLENICAEAIEIVNVINPEGNVDLLYEKSDILAWSYLGKYFSCKLKAATYYKTYSIHQKEEDFQEAIKWLEQGIDNWQALVAVTSPVYQPVPIEHKGYRTESNLFHWSIIYDEVVAELEWLKNKGQE